MRTFQHLSPRTAVKLQGIHVEIFNLMYESVCLLRQNNIFETYDTFALY